MKHNSGENTFSICIPIYNCDVSELVTELHRQSLHTGKPFEIVLIDDHSSYFLEENRKLRLLPQVTYLELDKNIGRAKIRNLLARKAQYTYLILMDCDAQVTDPLYIQKYLDEMPADIIIGGTGYSPTPPENKKQLLRWHYGISREARKASKRNEAPYKSFSPFNFMIRKEIFRQLQFDENISGYGHEDTLFGWELKKHQISVKHIDNPLIHLLFDDAEDFLRKTTHSVENLWHIFLQIQQKESFVQDNNLLKCYVKLRKYRLTFLIAPLFNAFRPLLYKNLLSESPNINRLDLYKLGLLNQIARNKKKQ
jgi:glycosyltransferase involved in cell wall biosynthesis